MSDFSGADLLISSGIEIDPNEFQPSDIGNDITRQILKRLQTMTPQDRAVINDELAIILEKCKRLQVVPLIPTKVSKSHNGNRQESDRVVKPLFARQEKTKRKRNDHSVQSAVDSAPKLTKTKKLIGTENQTNKSTFIGTETFPEYRALLPATLSDNIMNKLAVDESVE